MIFRCTICLVLVFTFAASVAVIDDSAVKLIVGEEYRASPGEARDLQELVKTIPGGSPILSSIICFSPVLIIQIVATGRRRQASPHSYLASVLVAFSWVMGITVLDVMMGAPYLLAKISRSVDSRHCVLCFVLLFITLEIATIFRTRNSGAGIS